ncbi:hypothetical protein [Aestuariivivens insulae]|uniref:hypothetical protein n=1 Tax=Aestuariivivens insulae TaxID=1621988 RepID=UPI001F593D47|nr:hypothetical protein [Aestuariivivens insulae]
MDKTTLDDIFKNLEHDFDTENPETGHEARFLKKLKDQDAPVIKVNNTKKYNWRSFVGIAASILLLITIAFGMQQETETGDLASISPKMAETQGFFTATIDEALNKLKAESIPEVQSLVQDALNQIKILETDYEKLKTDLIESGDDNRVIYAMISNFQNRITILKNTLEQIDTVKQLNDTSKHLNESHI